MRPTPMAAALRQPAPAPPQPAREQQPPTRPIQQALADPLQPAPAAARHAARGQDGAGAGRALRSRPPDATLSASPAFSFAEVAVLAPVQRLAAARGAGSPLQMTPLQAQAAADRGTGGAGAPLPHLAAIQRSFGRHDLSDVRAHTDAAARDAAQALHAQAYTRGRHVAFTASPSLQLAAHEAAHVVQQRAGLALPGGVGRSGDAHERHAEAVAHAVRDGRSTEALLDAYGAAAGGGTAGGIQRFASEEHQRLGDQATGSKKYDLADKTSNPGDKFELTHGDIVALSGDVFLPAELFALAKIPGNKGQLENSRDEVIWGLRDPTIWEMRSAAAGAGPYAGKTDPRFEAGGIWETYVFSKNVKKNVVERYQKLAAVNASHFAAPLGRDKKQQPIATTDSAGGKFREHHEAALKAAYVQGAVGGVVGIAMAQEAAAQHFLTDAFAAGHLRTPIAAIREHWGKRYPLFWYNLRHKIALDTAIAMVQGTVITKSMAYDSILADVEKMAPKLPAITFGDLLAKVFHDVDNAQGVAIAGGGKVMGDANLDPATEKLAIAAIQSGNKDVDEAFKLGAAQAAAQPMDDAAMKKQVRTLNGGTDKQYAAELMMPTPDKSQPPQNWKAGDIGTLWNQHMLGNKGDTVGAGITKTVQTGAIAHELNNLATEFPVDAMLGQLHPRAAYLSGFVAGMQRDPKAAVLDIVSWAPHSLPTGHAPRDMVKDLVAKGAAGNTKENLTNMRMDQRARVVRELIRDGGPGIVANPNGVPEDLEMIFTIFGNLKRGGRLELYKAVEGHDWSGDFQKTFGVRDELFKAMEKTGTNVDRLKKLLNGK